MGDTERPGEALGGRGGHDPQHRRDQRIERAGELVKAFPRPGIIFSAIARPSF